MLIPVLNVLPPPTPPITQFAGIEFVLIFPPDITGAVENVFTPPIVCVVEVSTNPLAIALIGTVPLEIFAPDITGATENVFDPPIVWVFDISTKVNANEFDETVPAEIFAPDITGAIENVFAPPIVCVVDVSTKPLATALVGIEPIGKLTVPELTVSPFPMTAFPLILALPVTTSAFVVDV
jgi:hypothetical protein